MNNDLAAGLPGGELRDSDAQEHVRAQYRSKDNLEVRIQTHQLYSEINVDFAAWVLDAINWRGDETVLDVGCGAGFYINAARERATRYIAGDLSFGMLAGLEESGTPRINLDAVSLPLKAGSVDVILANHMLYHVPDIDHALEEFRRVLGAHGTLIATTNSARNMGELESLERDVLAQLGIDAGASFRVNLTFTMENGAVFLGRHFRHVERRTLYDALVFPQAQPVIDYLASSFDRYGELLPDGITWQRIEETLRRLLEQKIQRYGEFRVNKLSGVFVAWNA